MDLRPDGIASQIKFKKKTVWDNRDVTVIAIEIPVHSLTPQTPLKMSYEGPVVEYEACTNNAI